MLAVQYATLELIDQSDALTKERVLDITAKLRARVNGEPVVTFDNLLAQVAKEVNFESWKPQDKLLASALVNRLEYSIDRLPEETREPSAELLTLIDWVEQAARMSK